MRSVAVVLPASIWAMMPMFLNLSKLMFAITSISPRRRGVAEFLQWLSLCLCVSAVKFLLEPIVSKSLVRLGHAVDVVFFLHRSAASVCRVEQFADQAVFHCFFAAAARVDHDPADRERISPVAAHLERNLIGRTADTALI